MTAPHNFHGSIARIWQASEHVAGAGIGFKIPSPEAFIPSTPVWSYLRPPSPDWILEESAKQVLRTTRHVFTCAHVVDHAIKETTDELGKVTIDFPLRVPDYALNAPRNVVSASVAYVDRPNDIAILNISMDESSYISNWDELGIPSDGLEIADLDSLSGHKFRCFGFPQGHDDGVWVSGEISGRQGIGLVQIEDVKETGYLVTMGFSGTPVWDEELNRVVGMIVAAEQQETVKAAFMVTASQLALKLPEYCTHEISRHITQLRDSANRVGVRWLRALGKLGATQKKKEA